MTPNQSHGHVTPNADGYLARCGGPKICKVCLAELAQLRAKSAPAEPSRGAVHARLQLAMKSERHCNNAETRYWCEQYRQIAIEALTAPPSPVKVAPVVFWALYDATTDVPYFKKMLPGNCLAIFDSEADAMRTKAKNEGTDYKGVYITSKPPAAQVAELVELLRDTAAWFADRDIECNLARDIDAKLASLKGVEA